MIGYIYKTTNLINDKVYIGKHEIPYYDSTYIGSGKLLKQAIKKYGKKAFLNEVLYEAETLEELNQAEKYYISFYKTLLQENCYNLAEGGTGGNALRFISEEDYLRFKQKMQIINKTRCNTPEFKLAISKATKARFSNEEERMRHKVITKEIWSNPDLRKRQAEHTRKLWEDGKLSGDRLYIPYRIIYQNEIIEFESRKAMVTYLKDRLNFNPPLQTIKKIMEDSLQNIPFKPFHRNKYGYLEGLMIFKLNESVETKADECKPVGREIDTLSKCATSY